MGIQAVSKNVKFTVPTYFYVLDCESFWESRRKYWEYFAIDRQRFKDKIDEIGIKLNPILSQYHRLKVFERNGARSPRPSP